MACFGAEEASIIAREAANRWLGERNKDLSQPIPASYLFAHLRLLECRQHRCTAQMAEEEI